jgi:hypothetical protein
MAIQMGAAFLAMYTTDETYAREELLDLVAFHSFPPLCFIINISQVSLIRRSLAHHGQ